MVSAIKAWDSPSPLTPAAVAVRTATVVVRLRIVVRVGQRHEVPIA